MPVSNPENPADQPGSAFLFNKQVSYQEGAPVPFQHCLRYSTTSHQPFKDRYTPQVYDSVYVHIEWSVTEGMCSSLSLGENCKHSQCLLCHSL